MKPPSAAAACPRSSQWKASRTAGTCPRDRWRRRRITCDRAGLRQPDRRHLLIGAAEHPAAAAASALYFSRRIGAASHAMPAGAARACRGHDGVRAANRAPSHPRRPTAPPSPASPGPPPHADRRPRWRAAPRACAARAMPPPSMCAGVIATDAMRAPA